MKTAQVFIFTTALSVLLNLSCSQKPLVTKTDPVISQTESSPPTATAPAEEKADQKALAAEFKNISEKKAGAKKLAKVRNTVPAVEPLAVAPQKAPPVVEANPELGGFFSRHFAWIALAGLAGIGYWFFLIFRKRRE